MLSVLGVVSRTTLHLAGLSTLFLVEVFRALPYTFGQLFETPKRI